MIYVTSEQMKKIDDIAVEDFKIKIEEMMELSGKGLSDFIFQKFSPKSVLILYGKGNNGAGGLVAARHLMNRGIRVTIVGASKINRVIVNGRLKTLRMMGVNEELDIIKADVVVDSLFGYNFRGSPKGNYLKFIDEVNSIKSKDVKIVSLDLPSGINADDGRNQGNFVRADYTITLALPKKAMVLKGNKFGKLYLLDIGIPKNVYEKLGLNIKDLFYNNGLLKI